MILAISMKTMTITRLLAMVVITLGAVLVVGGLFLMLANSIVACDTSANSSTSSLISSSLDLIPGVPLNMIDVSDLGLCTVGLVSWILGMDFILIGLGLWVRHRFARLVALLFFSLAACFQFIKFLLFGALGAPSSVVEMLVDGIIIYFLFSKFEYIRKGIQEPSLMEQALALLKRILSGASLKWIMNRSIQPPWHKLKQLLKS